MVVGVLYFTWIYWSPINLLTTGEVGIFPSPLLLLINTILYIPLISALVRKWLSVMTRRKGGPAGGIDTVEPGRGVPEPGDEWGRATRLYKAKDKSRIIGTKSEFRETIVPLDSSFFVRTPDLETGEELFDVEELRTRAMIRSCVASGGWIHKRVRSRSMGSLKASETPQHGRPFRSRMPLGEFGSIDIPSTVMAAVGRMGQFKPGERIKVKPQDIREKVFSGRTPLTIILVIDVSLSMKPDRSEVRKVISRIERETRGSKDRVGIVAFKDSGAIEVQAPTTNWNKIYRGLAQLRISGLTPLAEGLMKALETIRRERMRNPDVEPLVIVISDFAPNIPLAQSAGPGHAQYTPVRDLVKAARLIRKSDVRLVAVNVDAEQVRWIRFLSRPYHDALELATMLRMRKDGRQSVTETIMAVHDFRQSFGAYLIAMTAGGRAYLSREVLVLDSVLGEFLGASKRRVRLDARTLKEAESYIT